MGINLDDYVDVAARIVEFREKYPDGSLQPADPLHPYRIETIEGQTYIVVVAAAYRSPDDARPGIGMAYEQYPGKTNYTRNSELQNAETSAWGRAIVAALAADTKRGGIASADEVRNRRAEDDWESASPVAQVPTKAAEDVLTAIAKADDRASLSQAWNLLREHQKASRLRRGEFESLKADWLKRRDAINRETATADGADGGARPDVSGAGDGDG